MSQGYPPTALWVKNRDEVPPDQYPSMVEQAREITKAGWNTFSTFHHTLSNGRQTRFLTRQYKMLQGGMTNWDDYKDRLADGDIDWTNELWPHGKRINLGAYGGTPRASMSLSTAGNIANLDGDPTDAVTVEDLLLLVELWCQGASLLPEDMNRDGFVDLIDFAIFAEQWKTAAP